MNSFVRQLKDGYVPAISRCDVQLGLACLEIGSISNAGVIGSKYLGAEDLFFSGSVVRLSMS